MNTEPNIKEKRAQFLKETIEFSDKFNNVTEEILTMLNSTNTSILEPVKPLIHPRRNIDKIVRMYELFWDNHLRLKEKREKLESCDVFRKDYFEIDELEKIGILSILKEISECFEVLENHDQIKIIKQLIEQEKALFNEALKLISRSVIHALERLPNVVNNLQQYSNFLVKYSEDNEFIKEYSQVCKNRLGFVSCKENPPMILQQTKNLTKQFNMIKSLNNKLLGIKKARAVNEGLIKLLVLDLKVIISEILLKVEKKESPYDIIFLYQLYHRLKHSDGELVEEIEDLFVFKDGILKLIFNCFIQFFGLLNILEKPRADCKAEKLIVELGKILHVFETDKEFLRMWTSRFGSSFGIYNEKELPVNFSEKCILKVFELSDSLEIIEKSVYLINNIYSLKDYLHKISGLEVKEQLYKNCEIILGFIKIDIESQTPIKTFERLVLFLKKMNKMTLPEQEKVYLKNKLRKLVEQIMLREGLDGNLPVLFNLLESIFTGVSENSQ